MSLHESEVEGNFERRRRKLEEVSDGVENEEGMDSTNYGVTQMDDSWIGIERVSLPRKIFDWLYSFSLLILILVTLGFVAVTPIDVIAKTSQKSLSGIKMFIVIIVCVVFIVFAIFIYLLRIFQARIHMNDIPGRSLYVLGDGDLPNHCCREIEKVISENTATSVRAGPLYTSEVINHPGMSPPSYIQKRNVSATGEGTLLPPNSCYEDLIRSLSDRFKFDGKLFSDLDISRNLSMREIICHLVEMFLKEPFIDRLRMPNIMRLLDLYEKFRFGPDLIVEKELVEFMHLFYDLSQVIQNSLGYNMSQKSKLSATESSVRDVGYLDRFVTGRKSSWAPESSLYTTDFGEESRDWSDLNSGIESIIVRPNQNVPLLRVNSSDTRSVVNFRPISSKDDYEREEPREDEEDEVDEGEDKNGDDDTSHSSVFKRARRSSRFSRFSNSSKYG